MTRVLIGVVVAVLLVLMGVAVEARRASRIQLVEREYNFELVRVGSTCVLVHMSRGGMVVVDPAACQ